ncbi:hypothetical protein [Mycoplasma sp. 3686d]|uniref:hypothetical protein n=1 Tax=Mycoplasma sp. 3686d TaxID=2967300 RepID=UPI00211CE337|nr:hypothetical protein [Mycoplasma sp. 3686d]UUM24562.1 hypothetical protein NPA12_02570 [Mycoplasma sp. 3686d]
MGTLPIVIPISFSLTQKNNKEQLTTQTPTKEKIKSTNPINDNPKPIVSSNKQNPILIKDKSILVEENTLGGNDFKTKIDTLINNQTVLLNKYESLISISPINEPNDLLDHLKTQIGALKTLKAKNSIDIDNKKTFVDSLKQILMSIQEINWQIERSKFDFFKQLDPDLGLWLSTKNELLDIKSKLTQKQEEFKKLRESLILARKPIWPIKWELKSYELFSKTILKQLETLNNEVVDNQAQAKKIYDSVKELYEKIRIKVEDFIKKKYKDVSVDRLDDYLKQEIPKFNQNSSLKEMQVAIKTFINFLNEITNNLYWTSKDDYGKKFSFLQYGTLTPLETQFNELLPTLEELKAKKITLESNLNAYFNKVLDNYKKYKSWINKIKEQAIEWKIQTNDLDKFLVLPDFAKTDNLDEQNKTLKEYANQLVDFVKNTRILFSISRKLEQQLDLNIEKVHELENELYEFKKD